VCVKQGQEDVNKLRYEMYCQRNQEIESHQLPTCEDCLLQHGKKQIAGSIVAMFLSYDLEPPDPTQSG
jgi:hypothetical protein